MFDRRLIQNFDWGLMCITFLICTIGLTTLYSAVSLDSASTHKVLYIKQWIWYFAGLVAMIISFIVDYKKIERWAYFIYIVSVFVLIAVLLFGKKAGGAKRWLIIGPLTIQPSEFIKISVNIVLAKYFATIVKTEGLSLKDLIYPGILAGIPFILIAIQPDLGTGLMVLMIAGSITLFIKIEKKTLIFLIVVVIAGAASGWFFFLKDYQKQRVLTFLDPDRDPLGAGYHIIQSKIAIGSGMITGKGYLKGTQNALSFLPEQHTDFIFSVLAEEWGFIGSSLTCILLMMLIIKGLGIAYNCKDPFGAILAVGISSIIFWQAFINLGMIMGLMPVVGMPLPLISYGGSSVLSIMICIGLLANVSMRRFRVD